MGRFSSLSSDKQDIIISAAFTAFGKNGYKKASVNDIASAAGISKAMMFYYFGSKKEMYLNMVNLCGDMILKSLEENVNMNESDFFDRIKMLSDIKMSLFKKYPAALLFIKSAYYERDPQVAGETKKYLSDKGTTREDLLFDNIDLLRFKDDVDFRILYKFILLATEGFASNLQGDDAIGQVEIFLDELYTCLDFMKNNFYKKEFL